MAYGFYGLVALLCLIFYFIFSKIAQYIEARRFAKAHGCLPVRRYPQSERIIGWGFSKGQIAAAKNKCILETISKRWEEYGPTHSLVFMGRSSVRTIDPENVKAVLATNFHDFGLGQRLKAFGPLLGSGIFTSDGAHWEHSRVSELSAHLLSY
jgi:hypothetical protein